MASPNKSSKQDRLDTVVDRLVNRLEHHDGNPAGQAEVAEVVEEKPVRFEDAPIQDFVPLLAEKQARAELLDRGLRPAWENDDLGTA